MSRHFGLSHYQAAKVYYRVRAVVSTILMLLVAWLVILLLLPAQGREGDDHGNHGALKSWFDGLRSGKGLCCSFADGSTIDDADWDTGTGPSGKTQYKVRINGEWVWVDDDAVITEPNRFGKAVVWPIFKYNSHDVQLIRCFMPGAGT